MKKPTEAGGKLRRHIPPKRWAVSKLNAVTDHKNVLFIETEMQQV
jgi:hypothetical protein